MRDDLEDTWLGVGTVAVKSMVPVSVFCNDCVHVTQAPYAKSKARGILYVTEAVLRLATSGVNFEISMATPENADYLGS